MASTGLLLIWRDHFVARIVRPIDNITNMHFSRFNYFCVLMLITTLLALQTEASAQDSASAPQPTGASADSGEAARESATEQVSEEHVSDAERHKRLKETIELDQAKLAQTRKELDTQQVIFDRINALNEYLLPKLRGEVQLIKRILEEREREDTFRLKKIKQKKSQAAE